MAEKARKEGKEESPVPSTQTASKATEETKDKKHIPTSSTVPSANAQDCNMPEVTAADLASAGHTKTTSAAPYGYYSYFYGYSYAGATGPTMAAPPGYYMPVLLEQRLGVSVHAIITVHGSKTSIQEAAAWKR